MWWRKPIPQAPSADFERLAFEASQRGLQRQEGLLRELRARTGILLAASSLAASFLGRPAFGSGSGVLELVVAGAAVVAFGISFGASLYVLLPKDNLFFSPAGSVLYESLYEFRDDLPEVLRRLAYELDSAWESNQAQMERLFAWFRRAALALGVEVALLIVLVSGTLV